MRELCVISSITTTSPNKLNHYIAALPDIVSNLLLDDFEF